MRNNTMKVALLGCWLLPVPTVLTANAALGGSVVAWGDNRYGQTNVPAGLSNVTAIAAGSYHSAALKNDGTVVAWGSNGNGETNVPAGLSGVTAIAAGGNHTLALKSDGTVVAWGDNFWGETTGTPNLLPPYSATANPVTLNGVVLDSVVAISAGGDHSVALKGDGTVVAWGDNVYGQTNVPAGLSNVAAIAAGVYYTIALKDNGTVVAWGNNGNGQASIPSGLSGVTAIAAGSYHSVALKNDGTVVAWGSNGNGETNVPAGLSEVTAIVAGGFHTVALKNDGTVMAWGYNDYGQSTVPGGLSGVRAITAGGRHSAAITGTASAIAPTIVTQPAGQTVNAGQNASFTVTATGATPLNYQWRKDGVNLVGGSSLTGATSAALALANVTTGDVGNYTVVVSNVAGSVTSAPPAVLTVNLLNQTIAFGPLANKTFGDAPFTVSATASSGLPVSFSIVSGPATMSGNTVTLTGAGTVVVRASRAGNANYNPAPNVDQSFTVNVAPSGITPGSFITVAGLAGVFGSTDGTGNAARFSVPSGIAVDGAGNVYVADHGNHTLRKITAGGVVTTLAGLAGNPGSADGTGNAARFDNPEGLAVDSAGNVYVSDGGVGNRSGRIRKVTSAGVVTTLASGFYQPFGVAVDSVGNVYVADKDHNSIRKVTPAGVVTTLAGGSQGSVDGTGSGARFMLPEGVAVDSAGNVYVADTSNNTIRKVTPSGVVTTLAGLAGSSGSTDGTGSAARFYLPYGVAVDSAANVYVADYNNHTIRKVTPAGVVTTLAGLAGSSGSTDGTWSATRFESPQAVAVDSAGIVYVADTYNDTIRKGVPQGGVAPRIVTAPQSQTVNAGASVTFTVYVDGSLPLNFQWQFNGVAIPGATSCSLTLINVQPGNAGRYVVLVSNAVGPTVNGIATLAVLADPANGTPSAPVTITLPPQPPGKDSLIVITHGWQPSELLSPNVSWMHDMANTIIQKLAGQANWQVITVDWSQDAFRPGAEIPLRRAISLGNLLGPQIANQAWSHVHLIGHSAGAGLIQAAAHQIKIAPLNATTVHTTFLDPFVGYFSENLALYGQDADWSDTYFAQDISGRFTPGVPNSHNVDVTNLDPARYLATYLFGHGWLHEFYTKTVTNGFGIGLADTSRGYGFPLSLEGGNWGNKGSFQFPFTLINSLSFLLPADLPSNARPVINLTPLSMSGNIFSVSTPATVQINGGLFQFQNGGSLTPQSVSRTRNGIVTQSVTTMNGPVLEPAWVSVGVTVTNLVNYVKFDAGFTSAIGAQGLFSVYWGTNLLGELDERTASAGLQTYQFLLPDTYTDGQYTLGFRLDAYTTTPSSLVLTNVFTGFLGITNPPALTVAPSATNGPAQITLTGATGFYSILQSSTNLTNWTPVAALVNSNGTVQFSDTGATNQVRRFYRAVVP